MTLRLHPSASPRNENIVMESLITEAIRMYACDFFYMPRKLVALDKLLGEDRVSQFKSAYPVPMYMENSDQGFEGQQAFASKFGLQMEQSATLTVARREWNKLCGRYKDGQLPDRPAEGDLLYFPMTGGLFEIMFVQHQTPFYQAGQLYVYQLNVELFRYSSEVIDTGNSDIDVFESLKSHDPTINASADTPASFGDNDKFKEKEPDHFFNPGNPFGGL
jgi:Virus neck protein